MNLIRTVGEGLPRLSWCAIYDPQGDRIEVIHGSDVESHERFVVEGVWDGQFERESLYKAENFFGSALLIEDDRITAIPSRALVDRVLLCRFEARTYLSNSMPLLLAATGAQLDPDHDYDRESFAILKGIEQYPEEFHLLGPVGEAIRCEQIFYHPVTVSARGYERQPVAGQIRRFESYKDYAEYLEDVLRRIAENARSTHRAKPLQLRTTTSSGYDSAAVTVLVKDLGVEATYTRRRSNSMLPSFLRPAAVNDDGTPIAGPLQLSVRYLDSPASVPAERELLLLAATTAEPEVALHSLAEDMEREDQPTALFTGYHGDKAWDRGTSGKYLSSDLIRGDTSGLNLGEFRLAAGFINVAVPFIGARSIRDLIEIAESDEMRPWRLGTDYDRPIPRRIVESAGVGREVFGTRKKAVVQTYLYPWNPDLRRSFFRWLRKRHSISATGVYATRILNAAVFIVRRAVQKAGQRLGFDLPEPVSRVGVAAALPGLMHHWAVETLTADFAEAMNGFGSAGDQRQGVSSRVAAEDCQGRTQHQSR